MFKRTLTRSPINGAPFGSVPEDWPVTPPAPVPEPESEETSEEEKAPE